MLLPGTAAAGPVLGFSTERTSNYLLIGTGSRTRADAVDVDNRRLVGDIAVTRTDGDIHLSNITVIGTRGIDTAQTTVGDVTNGISNSTFNGMAFSGSNGIHVNQNFSTLTSDLAQAKTWIEAQTATQTFATDKFTGNTTITLQSGLNIIDLGKVGSDFLVENGTLTITAAAGVTDAVAIFRVVDKSFKTSNAAILADASVGLNNVLFYSGESDTVAFDLENIRSVDEVGIRGVAFWALGANAEIQIDNGNGCTQLVADKINLNNVDLELCAFNPTMTTNVIPAPAGVLLGLAGAGSFGGYAGLGWLRRRLGRK